jgi:predicted RNA-binding Zn-ribbon protein involved in translation (DUF1610 family)
MVTIVIGVCLAGLAALLAYALAALVPEWSRGRGAWGIYPSDELVAGVVGVATGAFNAAAAWLWSRRGRWRGIVTPTIYTVCIAVATIIVCLFIDSNLRGDKDLLFFGFIMLGGAGIILVWVARIYRISRGRPVTNMSDGLVNLHCPNCGYRMVGLRESRCPECGTEYTLDELLGKQNFTRNV